VRLPAIPTEALNGLLEPGLRILSRRPNPWASTFPSEIMSCEIAGRTVSVMAKFSGSGGRPAFGHRSGLEYELAVYRGLLAQTPISSPKFLGSCQTDWGTTLLIEFLGEGAGIDEYEPVEQAVFAAADWCGAFHRFWDTQAVPDWVRRYDSSYYMQWGQRTQDFARKWHERLPWLRTLCEQASAALAAIPEQPTTLIHGEFTPSNVLIHAGEIKPVDWESCAVGLGEIDLVALIEGWSPAIAAECIDRYRRARWGAEPSLGLESRLDLAWLYWHFRWLGERADWFSEDNVLRRSDHMYKTGKSMGLL